MGDLEERRWLYGEPPAAGAAPLHRGPVPASLLLRLLEKGVGVSPQSTLVWCPGLASWQPMSVTEPFAESCQFQMTQWYYLAPVADDDDGESASGQQQQQQKGPVLSRMLLHKLSSGELDGLTLVISSRMKEWAKVCDVPELRQAMQRLAEQEQEVEQRASEAALEAGRVEAEQQVFEPAMAGGEDAVASGGKPKGSSKLPGQAKPPQQQQHQQQQQHNWVYITGLPSDCNEGEVLAHFSRVGLVALHPATQQPKLKLYRDEQGAVKGDASLCYVAAQSADLAVDVLSGGYIRVGCLVTVERASFQSGEGGGAGAGGGAGGGGGGGAGAGGGKKGKSAGEAKDKGKGGATAAQRKTAYAATQQALSWAEDDDSGTRKHASAALKIVVIEGFFDPGSFAQGGVVFEQRLEATIAGECEAFGDIEKITVYSKHPAGITLVRFATAYAAQQCVLALNGRAVDTPAPPLAPAPAPASVSARVKTLRAYYWDGSTNFDLVGTGKRARDLEDDEDEAEREEKRRLEEFGSWIEEQDLPDEFQLRTE